MKKNGKVKEFKYKWKVFNLSKLSLFLKRFKIGVEQFLFTFSKAIVEL